MKRRKINWALWAGFLVSAVAFVSYFLSFSQFPATRDVPWVSFLLFATAGVLLVMGLRRAFRQSSSYRGRVAGPILVVLSIAILGFFCFGVFVESKGLPSSEHAPQVGQRAPQFSLSDTNGKLESLSELLATPTSGTSGGARAPKGVLLVFYRGYW